MPYRDFATAQAARLRSLEKRAAYAMELERRVEILEVENGTLRADNERFREQMLRIEINGTVESDDSPISHLSVIGQRLSALEACGDWRNAIELLDRVAIRTKRRDVQTHCRVRVARILDAMSYSAIWGNTQKSFSDSAVVRDLARDVLARIDALLIGGDFKSVASGNTALSRSTYFYKRLKELEEAGEWVQVTSALENLIRATKQPQVRREALVRIARIEEEIHGDFARACEAYKFLLADNPADSLAKDRLLDLEKAMQSKP